MNVTSSRRASLTRSLTALGAVCLALSLTACGTTATKGSGRLDVSVSFYPIQYLVEGIGGEHVQVTSVTPGDVEPHDYELSPKEVSDLGKADLITYVKGFQGSLDEAVEKVSGPTVVDLSGSVNLVSHAGGHNTHDHAEHEHEHGHTDAAGHDHADHEHEHEHGHNDAAGHEHEHGHTDAADHDHAATDPHFWLDPQRMVLAAQAVAAALTQADPEHAADYQAGLAAVTEQLNHLDASYSTGLQTCERRTIVTNHAAFGYLAERYNLSQTSISGVDPESEPSPADLAKVKKVVQETGTTTIFTEERVSEKTAQVVAQETGVTTAVLSPMEVRPQAGDYPAAMEANLSALKTALACQ
ncbi:metal ABC transporter substrate-binding protein [Actinomyces weissii]|nr:metal ABC transporter substrate-binding protein [Actinomyces weissii]